jgi:hypothetical protein
MLMPNGQSLWIDEGFTIQYANLRNFPEFVDRLERDRGSEVLMPLGMLSTWVGASVLGTSEWRLRVVSAVWAGVAVALMWRIGVIVGLPWMALAFACHPFLWYYGAEVRPYSMTIAMSTGVLLGLVSVLYSEGDHPGDLWAMLLFGPLLCATNILGVVPYAVSAALVLLVVLIRRRRLTAAEYVGSAISGAVIAGLGVYYLAALSKGADTSWKGSPWSFNVGNLSFSIYEMLGFAGFGPGRYELRQLALQGGVVEALGGLIRPTAVGVIGLVMIYGLCLVGFWKLMRSRRSPQTFRAALAVGCVAVATLSVTVAAFSMAGNSFWGRHLAAVLPFLVFLVVLAADWYAGRAWRGGANWVTWALICLLVTSSLIVRFHPEHGRDDYRSASRYAKREAEKGQIVWWAADPRVAGYYGVPLCADEPALPHCISYVTNKQAEFFATREVPDVVILSKPELHDRFASLRKYLESNNLVLATEFTAFQAYRSTHAN